MEPTAFVIVLLVALALAHLRTPPPMNMRAGLRRLVLVAALVGVAAGLVACPRTPQSPSPEPVYDGNPNGEDR